KQTALTGYLLPKHRGDLSIDNLEAGDVRHYRAPAPKTQDSSGGIWQMTNKNKGTRRSRGSWPVAYRWVGKGPFRVLPSVGAKTGPPGPCKGVPRENHLAKQCQGSQPILRFNIPA